MSSNPPWVAVCQNYNQTQKLSDCIKAAGKTERNINEFRGIFESSVKIWNSPHKFVDIAGLMLTKSEVYALFFFSTYFP